MDVSYAALSNKVTTFVRVNKTNEVLAQNARRIDDLVQEILPLAAAARGEALPQGRLKGLSEEKKICLRPDIYRLRYKIIHADQKVQSCIKSKFEKELNSLRKQGVQHLNEFFYSKVLHYLPDEKSRKAICKLLNISSMKISQTVREVKVNRNAHTLLEKHAS
jgi:hypothetical protein